MPSQLLLTSFDVWEPHQVSNSSDDLLAAAIAQQALPTHADILRRLPVDFQLAPERVISAITALQPDTVICCGMAEQRHCLTVESNGKFQGEILATGIELTRLTAGTIATDISHDAGNFVCNHLYYSILQHLRDFQPASHCLFIHVPVLHETNLASVMQDFVTIVKRLGG